MVCLFPRQWKEQIIIKHRSIEQNLDEIIHICTYRRVRRLAVLVHNR